MFLHRALVLGKAIMHKVLVCLFVCLFSFFEGARGGAGKLGQVLKFFQQRIRFGTALGLGQQQIGSG
jgi:hypothetical protein